MNKKYELDEDCYYEITKEEYEVIKKEYVTEEYFVWTPSWKHLYYKESNNKWSLKAYGPPEDKKQGYLTNNTESTTLSNITSRDQLVEGEIYFYSYSDWEHDYIEEYKSPYRYIGINKKVLGDGLVGFVSCLSHSFDGYPGLICRLATSDEVLWFAKCIEANKFIPKNEIGKSKELVTPKQSMDDKLIDLDNKSAKSLDLVEGKWYKITAFNNDIVYWVKYNKLWNYCEYIRADWKEHYKEGAFTNVKVICELSPDIYEPYLPKEKQTKTIKNEDISYIWYRLTNTALLAKKGNYVVSWKVDKNNRSKSYGHYNSNGEYVSYINEIDTSSLVQCSEEEASSYFKELIDTPKDKSNPITPKDSYSSEITWEELLRSDGKWVNISHYGFIGNVQLSINNGKRVFILSNDDRLQGNPAQDKKGHKYSYELGNTNEINGYKTIIKSWASNPSQEKAKEYFENPWNSFSYPYGVDPIASKEEPKLLNLSDDVFLLTYREEKQTLLKID